MSEPETTPDSPDFPDSPDSPSPPLSPPPPPAAAPSPPEAEEEGRCALCGCSARRLLFVAFVLGVLLTVLGVWLVLRHFRQAEEERPGPKPPAASTPAPDDPALPPSAIFPVPSDSPLTLPPGWDRARLLDQLAAGLERLARQRLPGGVVSRSSPEGPIRLVWQSRMYDVRRPTGKHKGAKTVVRREEGPAPAGLILTVWLGDGITQAKRPQVLDNDGRWKTYLGGGVHVPALQLCLMFNLDYGPQTAPELIRFFSAPQEWLAATQALPDGAPPGRSAGR